MPDSILITAEGAIGVEPGGSVAVPASDGRCPACGCGDWDDGDPTDPPPPPEPDTYYLGSPCDPNAEPLNRPVVFYVPPRDEWPEGGFQYDCTSGARRDTTGRSLCYFFTGRSPTVTGEVVYEPGSPYVLIDGREYYVVGAAPVQNTCCSCRDDCGTFRTPYVTEIIDADPNVLPKTCDPEAMEANIVECCCDADGEINYVGYWRQRLEGWTLNPYPPFQWLPNSIEIVQRLTGKKPDDQTPGACVFDVETTEQTWRDTGTALEPLVRTSVQRNNAGQCDGCVWPRFGGEPWECIVPSGVYGCSGSVEYRCNRYTGRRECKVDNGNAPTGSFLMAWNQQTLFAQGDCTAGCKDSNQPTARPPASGTRSDAPGGVPRLF